MAFPEGWGRKCKLTIDPAKVDADLTDFPVLLTEDNLPEEMFDADGSHPALNGGGDIRFSTDSLGATRLACEVVSFVTDNDPANGSAEIWVKIPSVSATVDTDFYIWYDKAGESQPAANDTYGSQNVWDSDFVGVWHLQESGNGTSGEYKDSTANANHGQGGGGTSGKIPAQIDAKWGKGQDFDGSNDYILLPSSISTPIGNNITLSAWVKADGFGTGRGILTEIYNAGGDANVEFGLLLGNSVAQPQRLRSGFFNGSWRLAVSPTNYTTGNWDLIWGNYEGTTVKLYQNITQLQTHSYTGSLPSGTSGWRIGRVHDSATEGSDYNWDGIIDECRVHKTNRTAEWMAAEWNNQDNPATFITVDTPQNITPPPVGSIFGSPIFGGN